MSRFTTRQGEQSKPYSVGSTYFFGEIPGFEPGDLDQVIFETDPKLYKNVLQFRKHDKTHCLFKWRKLSADEFVDYTLRSKLPMELGKFLVPEVCDYLGFTLDHLKKLQPVVEKLDKKHLYEKVIYDSYLRNGGFFLTEEQRINAYIEYLKYR